MKRKSVSMRVTCHQEIGREVRLPGIAEAKSAFILVKRLHRDIPVQPGLQG